MTSCANCSIDTSIWRLASTPSAVTATPSNPLCVSLHDVAPVTWPACRFLLDRIDALGISPVTLLVVPNYHNRGPVTEARAFRHAIEGRIRRGDEIVLHGFTHRDESPAPATVGDRFRRRVLTAGEGEFAAASYDDARRRIEAGLAMFTNLEWPCTGFVPPAWLCNTDALRAITDSGISYTTTRSTLVSLSQGLSVPTTNLVYSARSGWRRTLSRLVVGSQAGLAAGRRVLRATLHPADAGHAHVVETWCRLLDRARRARLPVTKAKCIEMVT
jgi:predicted deacetylase